LSEQKLREYLRRATASLRDANERIRVLERSSREPIAVVSMGCRFPGGVSTPEQLWRLVAEGVDAISAFPVDRGWDLDGLYDPDPDRPGKSYVREGGFVEDVAAFDAEFFGISPREALAMDPQQRLLLEVAWETFERAGIDPHSLRGSRTGVFAGVMYHDYLANAHQIPHDIEGHAGLGSSGSVLSGRVSYVFGLEGPALSIDTACSSSLVAIHVACQSLRSGESSLALAGGVTVISDPHVFVEMSRQRALAVDGRCKSFAAAADGTGLAEGVGLVLLERLSDARRHGHPVLGVIRGSAVNQDGASNGLTAPNGPSQMRVIRQALSNAGLTFADVDVVEAHGTGTPLGDPIEAQALAETYGSGRDRGRPLWLGSVKSNIGHTQAAAGVSGLIKMLLALHHRTLPPTLHVGQASPHVDWSDGLLKLLTASQTWPSVGRPRRAGVSSFGVSGTNAHVVVEEAADRAGEDIGGNAGVLGVTRVPVVLSARSAFALRELADRVRAVVLANRGVEAGAVARALGSRSLFEFRAVVAGGGREEFAAGLEEVSSGLAGAGLRADRGRVVFVFGGQGGQWVGMGRELAGSSPVFADVLGECDRVLAPFVGWSVLDVVRGVEGAPSLDRVDVVQPVLFAVMVGVARLWMACGVRPAAVVGHSQGEIAAACVAGVLSLEDAARLVAARSQILAKLSGAGALASVAAGATEVAPLISRQEGRVCLAAVNGPASVVVSGEVAAVEELLAECAGKGISTRRLADIPSHSVHVELVYTEAMEAAAGLSPARGNVTFVSSVTGGVVGGAGLDAGYWYRNLREMVRFEDAVRGLAEGGFGTFVEVSPHPVLAVAIEQTLEVLGCEGVVVGSLRRGGGADRFALSAAELRAAGVAVDWAAVTGAAGCDVGVDLPTYPFQRERYWLASGGRAGDAASLGLRDLGHPLVGAVVEQAEQDGFVFSCRVSLAGQPWLGDHEVFGVVVVPGAAVAELAATAGAYAGAPVVEELTLQTPLVVPRRGGVALRVWVGATGESGVGVRPVQVSSRPADLDGPWTLHASGGLAAEESLADAGLAELAGWPPEGAEPLDVTDVYGRLNGRGYGYGPVFQGLRAAWRRGEITFAEVVLPEPAAGDAQGFTLHPALLDAALHALSLNPPGGSGDEVLLPFSWSGVRFRTSGVVGVSRLRVRLCPAGGGGVSLTAVDEAGRLVVSVGSLVLRAAPAGLGAAAVDDALFGVVWEGVRVGGGGGDWVVVAGFGDSVVRGCGVYSGLGAVGAAFSGGGVTAGPVVLPVLSSDFGGDVSGLVCGVLAVLQAWLADERFAEMRLVVVTSGGAGPEGGVADVGAAAVWGLVRSAMSEHPGRFALVDVDVMSDAVVGAGLAAAEPECAVRGGNVLVPRLARREGAACGGAVSWGNGTVLVTGGLGGVGAAVARHLAVSGVRHLMLVGRRGMDTPGAGRLVEELAGAGAEVSVRACDVGDRIELTKVITGIPEDRPLTGVIHAAGVLADATVSSLTPQQVQAVFRPKVDGAAHLHELTKDMRLSAFVVFSSVAATFGAPGQGNYAAANAGIEALVRARRARNLPGIAIAWGLWETVSDMTGHLSGTDRARLSRNGFLPISAAGGLELFDAAVGGEDALLVAARLDVAGLRVQARDGLLPPLLRTVVRVPHPAAYGSPPGGAGDALRSRLAGLPAEQQAGVISRMVRELVAVVLGFSGADAVQADRVFKDLGFDSLTAVEFRNRLARAAGLRLSPTLVFDYPTVTELADYLRGLLVDEPAGELAGPGPLRTPAPGVDAEPVAIVSMACRFPGGIASPEDLWGLVSAGGEVIGEFPRDRGWDLGGLFDADPARPGTSYASSGGFLYDAGEFDAAFFGISPREALAMDPQQRLLLETAWEAVERARIAPQSLRGSATGVFVGVMANDYGWGSGREAGEEVEGYVVTGTAGSVASGRVAYLLGLQGPAVSVDTACSSSLVALHWASASLRSGECSLALAGGVTVMSGPLAFVEFSRQRGMAPDGRCKPFSASADGAGWSEGAGVVVLERLSDARRHGHPVLAVIRGSAVNQDGASNGLTAPSGPAQQQVIRQALANAGVSAAEVDVVEAHGTGTVLGDPIEAQALLATYGKDHDPKRPLLLGSVKSNLGHTQAAAGMAGVIKMVMAMRHELLPQSLHITEPTPHVDWSSGAVELLDHARPWPASSSPRLAGISSFGISGTNAHLILQQPPTPQPEQQAPATVPSTAPSGLTPEQPPGPVPWVLSAHSPEALQEQAARLARLVETETERVRPADVAWSLVTSRSLFDHRAVMIGHDQQQLTEALSALAQGRPHPALTHGVVRGNGRLAMMFPGQGAQRLGMGRALAAQFPAFTEALDTVIGELDRHLQAPLRPVMWGDDEQLLAQTGQAQPALFAIEVALARLLQSCGMRPDFVAGHSLGEITAAHVAGVLSLSDAAQLVAARARLMQSLPPGGAMLSVAGGEQEILELFAEATDLADHLGRVAIAAINAPGSAVISGDANILAELATRWQAKGRAAKPLKVSHAFHSPLVEPVLADFEKAISGLTYHEPTIPIVSNLTGHIAAPGLLTSPAYWIRHIRQPVQFADGVHALHQAGADQFLEVGPGATLTALINDSLGDTASATTLSAGTSNETRTLLTALATCHTHGTLIDWTPLLTHHNPHTIDLPTYPYQRQHYWLGGSRPYEQTAEHVESKPVQNPRSVPHFAGLAEPARLPMLLDEVRSQAATALGFDSGGDIDPGRTFIEQGMDSMTAVDLSVRLNKATGVRISKNAAFEYNTPEALAGHLALLLAEPAPERITGVEGLYRQMISVGRNDLAMDLIKIASRLMPTFDEMSLDENTPMPIELAKGQCNPELICFPSFAAIAGTFQYLRLAKEFAGSHKVTVYPNPGYDHDEAVPLDLETFINAQAQAIMTHASDHPFVLLGHSAGGMIAHAVATQLTEAGRLPIGCILIDAPQPGALSDDTMAAFGAEFMARDNLGELGDAIDDNWLIALGAYLRMMDTWVLEPHDVPTLLVRATEALPNRTGSASPGLRFHAEWNYPHETVDVPGNHFTLMEEHAQTTAIAIKSWIANLQR